MRNITTASALLDLAGEVTTGVAREEALLTRRDRHEDRGNTAGVEYVQQQIDAITDRRWELHDEFVTEGLIPNGATEEDLIARARTIAGLSLYAAHRQFGLDRA